MHRDAGGDFQRQRGVRQRAGIGGDARNALRVGGRHGQIKLRLRKAVIHPAKLPACPLRKGIGVGENPRLAIAGQA